MSPRLVVDASPLFPLAPGLGPTGVGRWTVGAVGALARQAPEWRIDLVATGLRRSVPDPDLSWAPPNVSLRWLRLPGKACRWLWASGSLPRAELLLGPMAAFLGPAYATWPARHAVELPVVHDLTHVHYPQCVSPRNLQWLRLVLPRVIRRAAVVVTGSDTTREEIINHYRLEPSRVAVVPSGCDWERWHGAPVEPHALRIPESYLLFVGTIEPRKNVARLLEAYALLRQTGVGPPPLVIAGGIGWLSDDVARMLDRLSFTADGVLALGYVDDTLLPTLYANATALVLPSLYEGFGLPVLEAMAAGCPVLTSDRGALREVGGDAVAYVDPKNPADIARAIERVLADDKHRRRLAEAGRQRAAAFTWNTAGAALKRAVEGAVARRAVR